MLTWAAVLLADGLQVCKFRRTCFVTQWAGILG